MYFTKVVGLIFLIILVYHKSHTDHWKGEMSHSQKLSAPRLLICSQFPAPRLGYEGFHISNLLAFQHFISVACLAGRLLISASTSQHLGYDMKPFISVTCQHSQHLGYCYVRIQDGHWGAGLEYLRLFCSRVRVSETALEQDGVSWIKVRVPETALEQG